MRKLEKQLRRLREVSGLSQGDVAKKLGYKSPQIISNWEREQCPAPDGSLKKLAKLYGANYESLIELRIEDYRQQLKAIK